MRNWTYVSGLFDSSSRLSMKDNEDTHSYVMYIGDRYDGCNPYHVKFTRYERNQDIRSVNRECKKILSFHTNCRERKFRIYLLNGKRGQIDGNLDWIHGKLLQLVNACQSRISPKGAILL
jgi:hypothetical protein